MVVVGVRDLGGEGVKIGFEEQKLGSPSHAKKQRNQILVPYVELLVTAGHKVDS